MRTKSCGPSVLANPARLRRDPGACEIPAVSNTLTPLISSEGHTVPVSYGEQLVQLVGRWGITPDALLCRVGLGEAALKDPVGRLSMSTWVALLDRARALTAEPGLGFYLGLQKRISGYGYLGFAAMTASSLGEALELVTKFSATVTTSVSLRLRVEGSVAALVVEEHVDLGSVRDIALISLVSGMRQLGRTLTGKETNGTTELTIPQPTYFPRFHHLMPGARFGQPVSQVVFDAASLTLPLVQADPVALRLMRDQCERALDALGYQGGFVERVRRALWRDGGRGVWSLENVAESLAVSTRTLKRMLAAQGTSFSALLDRERREKAMVLLNASRASLDEIAERLGYSTPSNFGRAFHQWTGMTPGAYRRARRGFVPQRGDDSVAVRQPHRN
jgi:AraC-like DNA-binding protein